MKNLKIYLPLVDGSSLPIEYNNGKELIEGLISDDIGPPPSALCIAIKHTDGKTYNIRIPNDRGDEAYLSIED